MTLFSIKFSIERYFHGSKKRGYTLLFSVIVSVLVLSIGAFILSVSRKQLLLSSSARDSIYAFYAADGGLECAVANLTKLSMDSTETSVSCAPGSIARTSIVNGAATSTIQMPTGSNASASERTQSGAASCAIVSVGQVIDGAGATTTIIESRGYNIGWDYGAGTCTVTGPRKVERALRLIYL